MRKEQLASKHANNSFEHCHYTYTDDKRLTDFDKCKPSFLAGWEAGQPKWVNVEEQTPDFNIPVLIKYIKGKQGEVITQGYYRDEAERMGTYPNSNTDTEFWRNCGYGLTWFDYSGRQIQNLVAKGSKNKVIQWMPIPK
jgi:hypothetical protein